MMQGWADVQSDDDQLLPRLVCKLSCILPQASCRRCARFMGLAGRTAPEQPRSAEDDTEKDDASEEAGEWQEVAYSFPFTAFILAFWVIWTRVPKKETETRVHGQPCS